MVLVDFGKNLIWEQRMIKKFDDERIHSVGIIHHLDLKSLVDEGIVIVNHDNIDIKADCHGMTFSGELCL